MRSTSLQSLRLRGATGPNAAYLRYGMQSILLPKGFYLFGRSPECHFGLSEGLVSRRHCALEVEDESALLKDLRSVNGVYVNGRRMAGTLPLKPQDRLRLGHQEFIFERGQPSRAIIVELDQTLRQVGDMVVTASPATLSRFSLTAPNQVEATHQTSILELIGRNAEALIGDGKLREAERLLQGHLERVLREQQLGQTVDDDTFRDAIRLSLRLARASRERHWFDHAVNLLRERKAPCSERLAKELGAAMQSLKEADPSSLYDYARALRQLKQGSLEHLASAQRVEELANRRSIRRVPLP